MTPFFMEADGSFPIHYYALAATLFVLYNIPLYAIFVSKMAFFARISDPIVGGTYMTLLNTFQNLGYMWPSSFVFWVVDQVTVKSCIYDPENEQFTNTTSSFLAQNSCYGKQLVEQCTADGGSCKTISNGIKF